MEKKANRPLRGVPKTWLGWAAVFGSGSALLLAALVGAVSRIALSMTGILVVSLLAYFNAEHWWSVSPLTPSSAVLEFSTWSAEERFGVFTSLMTIIGFLLAFMTAHWSSVQASQRQIRNDAQEEIRVFFDTAFRGALTIQTAAERLLALHLAIRGPCVIDDVQLKLTVFRESYPQLKAAQDTLAECSMSVHSLRTKYAALFNAYPLVGLAFDQAANRLGRINRARTFPTPLPEYRRDVNLIYVLESNPRKWRHAISTIKKNGLPMLGFMGGAFGKLGSGVFPISPASWLIMGWKAWREFTTGRR